MATKRNPKIAIFYPRRKPEIPAYYNNFAIKLSNYATKYGLTDDEVAKIVQYNQDIAVKANEKKLAEETAQQKTRAYDELLAQAEIDAKRIMKKIVCHENFTKSDGEDLGFIKEKSRIDLNTVKPKISNISVLSDKVIIDWVKAHMHGVVVYSSYDGANWTEIGRDMRSPFEDKRPNTSNQPETRYYKLRYIYNDELVGLESNISKVFVEIYQ